MFINYNPHSGLTINTFAIPEGYFCTYAFSFVEDVLRNCPACIPLEGVKEELQSEESLQELVDFYGADPVESVVRKVIKKIVSFENSLAE